MNFIEVTLNGNRLNDGKGFDIVIPEGKRKVLDELGYQGKRLTFGIRPEDIASIRNGADTTSNAIVKAEVVISELLGSDSVLYCKLGEQEFSARVSATDYLAPGSTVDLALNVSKGHFFDAQTGKRIALR